MEHPGTGDANTEDGTYIGYQLAGEGPDLAWQLQILSGVHTGEVELDGDDVRGIAVHIGVPGTWHLYRVVG